MTIVAVAAELLQHHRLEQDRSVVRHYIEHDIGAEDDQLAARTGGGDVEAVAVQKELGFGRGILFVGNAVGDEHDVALLPLQLLDRVDKWKRLVGTAEAAVDQHRSDSGILCAMWRE